MALEGLDVRRLWASFQSSASIQRYRNITHDRPSEAELLTFHSQQQSITSASSAVSSELRPQKGGSYCINDTAPDAALLEETRHSSDRNNLVNSIENNSPPNSELVWIEGVYLCAKASAVLLLLNIIFISIAGGLASNHQGSGGSSNSKVIYDGSCTITSRWSMALHLIINILSTCILAASNYCMQTLVAPTRDEIDVFHTKRRWLDIGGASFRNLSAIPFDRLGLWVILLITATPFHLLYELATIIFFLIGTVLIWLIGITPLSLKVFLIISIGRSSDHTILMLRMCGI